MTHAEALAMIRFYAKPRPSLPPTSQVAVRLARARRHGLLARAYADTGNAKFAAAQARIAVIFAALAAGVHSTNGHHNF